MDRSPRWKWRLGSEPTPWPVRQRIDRVGLATRIGWTLFAFLLLGALYRGVTEGF